MQQSSVPEAIPTSVVREGLVTGLLGGVAVALWFLLIDALRGQPLFTPAALGSALFGGARSVAEVEMSVATVGVYTIVHFAAFFAIGILASAFALASRSEPRLVLGMALVFVTLETLALGAFAILAAWLLGTLQVWTILVANAIAAVAMGLYLWRHNPALRAAVDAPVEERV